MAARRIEQSNSSSQIDRRRLGRICQLAGGCHVFRRSSWASACSSSLDINWDIYWQLQISFANVRLARPACWPLPHSELFRDEDCPTKSSQRGEYTVWSGPVGRRNKQSSLCAREMSRHRAPQSACRPLARWPANWCTANMGLGSRSRSTRTRTSPDWRAQRAVTATTAAQRTGLLLRRQQRN